MEYQLETRGDDVNVKFITSPIPLYLYNLIRRFLYAHVAVWAFHQVEFVNKKNPYHNSCPSELIVNTLKQVIITSEFLLQIKQNRQIEAAISFGSTAKVLYGSDIVFTNKSFHCFHDLHVSPSTEIMPFYSPSMMKNEMLNIVLAATLASASDAEFDGEMSSNRYAVSNVHFLKNEGDYIQEITYKTRGHFIHPEVAFIFAMESILKQLDALEIGFRSACC